jgi:hypothetical protein
MDLPELGVMTVFSVALAIAATPTLIIGFLANTEAREHMPHRLLFLVVGSSSSEHWYFTKRTLY